MAKDQGADKTEQPTPKKLRDARKDANVSKSKELTSTVLVLGWLVGGWMRPRPAMIRTPAATREAWKSSALVPPGSPPKKWR